MKKVCSQRSDHSARTVESKTRICILHFRHGKEILHNVGRSKKGIELGTFEFLENCIEKFDVKNVAFGAHFADALKTSKIKTWFYPPESLSKNVILEKDCVKITPSSFNLNPVKIIEL